MNEKIKVEGRGTELMVITTMIVVGFGLTTWLMLSKLGGIAAIL